MALRHPCISGTIGIILPSQLRGLQIIRMYCVGRSLSEVISNPPEWWTPTAKAKAIVAVVLGLRFAHSLGLFHGHLTGNNILFDDDGMVRPCDFCVKG
jgi:serine/threonine protein kinase